MNDIPREPVMIDVTYWVPTRYCVPLNAALIAAKLRAAGDCPKAAELAGQIASGEITDGHASETDGLPFSVLAKAISAHADLFGVNVPAGEPTDHDTAEDYHVWAESYR